MPNHTRVAIASESPNQYEIHIGGKQTLTLNAENLEEIYLSVRDAENQAITLTETGQAQITWTEPEKIDDTQQVDSTDYDISAQVLRGYLLLM